MQKWFIACLFVCSFTWIRAQSTYADKANKYIDEYKWLAMQEQKRSGIPAAVTLGQGILETQAGCSELMTNANNHFGIKCKSNWTGETFAHTDDAPNECFRKYKCAEDSYRDHSDYLKNTPRYACLFQLSPTDYASWAIDLKKCGYATNPHYAQQLIKIIEDFHLQQYTYDAMNDTALGLSEPVAANETKSESGIVSASASKETAAYRVQDNAPVANILAARADTATIKGDKDVQLINGLKAVYAKKGDMPLQYAAKYHIRYERFLQMNDLPDAPLACGTFLYLENKENKGFDDSYTVRKGETLWQIAQMEGIKLDRLMSFNYLSAGEEPVAGSVLQLRKFAYTKPQIVTVDNKAMNATAIKKQAVAANIGDKPANVVPVAIARPQFAAYIPERKPAGKVADVSAGQPEITNAIPANARIVQTAAKDSNTQYVKNILKTDTIAKAVPAVASAVKKTETHNADIVANNETSTITDTPPQAAIAPQNTTDTTVVPPGSTPELERLKAALDKVVYADYHDSKPADTVQQAATPAPRILQYYTVKRGDTPYAIARDNNITVQQLMQWNNLDFSGIKVGQRLLVKK